MQKIDFKSKKFWLITVFRVLMIISSLLLIKLYYAPLKVKILNAGNFFGLSVAAVLFIFAIFFNQIINLIKKICEKKVGKALVSIFLVLVIAGCTLFTGTLASVISNSHQSATNETTVVVLGCRIWGSRPSGALKARVRAAKKHLEKNPDAVVILSGGQGSDEDLSEAQCMYNLLVEDGIDPSRLYIEDKSTSTDENIAFSKKIMQENNLSMDVAVATTDYHQKRAKMICKKNGLNSTSLPSKSGKDTRATFFTREVFGVWAQWLNL